MESQSYIRAWWGRKTQRAISADLGITKQRVSQIGHRLGLARLTPGGKPGKGVTGTCKVCGQALWAQQKKQLRKYCDTCKQASLSAKAYHLKRVSGWTWKQVADRLAYRLGAERRGHNLVILAKQYAQRVGFAWPITRRSQRTNLDGMESQSYIRAWWGRKTQRAISADLGITKQRVSQIGHRLGLARLTPGGKPGKGVTGTCKVCGQALWAQQKKQLRKYCDTCKQASLSAKAYHLKRVSGWTWKQVADRLAYRLGAERRGHNLVVLAKQYAQRAGFTWPITRR